MYVIESNDPYSRRSVYFTGLDEVTRRAQWDADQQQAVRFADQASADRLNSEALLGRTAQSKEA